MECERPDDSLPGATIDRQAEVRLLQLNFRVGGASVAAVWAALKALLGSCCISRREQVHVSFSGKVGYGHEETIIQALGAALKGHHLTLEQAGSSNARASAPEAAILFYRVAARLDVEDILRQMKTLTEEHPQVPVAVVLAHNVSVEQMQRKHGSKMASSNSWQRLLASRAFIVDMLFDEGCWPAAQNKEALQCLCTFVRDRHREARSSAVVDVS